MSQGTSFIQFIKQYRRLEKHTPPSRLLRWFHHYPQSRQVGPNFFGGGRRSNIRIMFFIQEESNFIITCCTYLAAADKLFDKECGAP